MSTNEKNAVLICLFTILIVFWAIFVHKIESLGTTDLLFMLLSASCGGAASGIFTGLLASWGDKNVKDR